MAELKHIDRPVTTLFMLQSLDGKISTGSLKTFDFDSDLPKIEGVKEGLHWYYDIEQTIDKWSLCTGKTQAKIGANTKKTGERKEFSLVIVDNKHLKCSGVQYLCSITQQLVVVTNNRRHPAYNVINERLSIVYQPKLDLEALLVTMKRHFGCDRITIQSGGTLNAELLKQGLIDKVDVVVVPLLVGGKDTPTTIDGVSLNDLEKLGILKLKQIVPLEDSYIRLRYEVVHNKET